MKKMAIGTGLLAVVFVVLVVWLSKTVGDQITNEVDKIETKVGQKLILQKDTLMIIDYSVFNSNYTLEDGRQISFDLADKLEWVGENKTTTKAD